MTELRPARSADLPDIVALAARCFADPWPESAFRQELDPPEAGGAAGGRLWVAAVAGRVIGFAALRRVLDELHVLSLAVDAGERRRGVASRLLDRALRGEPGVRVLHLEVRAGNASALGFYEALGFVAVGRRSRYYDDGEDAVLMTRNDLPPAAKAERPDQPAQPGRATSR